MTITGSARLRQDLLTEVAVVGSVLYDGTHRRNTGAGANADDRRCAVRRETEKTLLQADRQLIACGLSASSPSHTTRERAPGFKRDM